MVTLTTPRPASHPERHKQLGHANSKLAQRVVLHEGFIATSIVMVTVTKLIVSVRDLKKKVPVIMNITYSA